MVREHFLSYLGCEVQIIPKEIDWIRRGLINFCSIELYNRHYEGDLDCVYDVYALHYAIYQPLFTSLKVYEPSLLARPCQAMKVPATSGGAWMGLQR